MAHIKFILMIIIRYRYPTERALKDTSGKMRGVIGSVE